tara:strand:+ start:246 stop:749 length:504 start_codon:yes stop_codon:yes gene_type:complete
MTFWDNQQNPISIKRSHRFVLLIEFDSGENLSFFVQSLDKPSFTTTVDEATDRDGKTFYWATGHLKWEPITITFVNNERKPNFDKIVHNLQSGELRAKIFPKITIQELSGGGIKIGEWRLGNCKLENVQYSSLDYGNEDFQTVTMTVKYHFAKYQENITFDAQQRGS